MTATPRAPRPKLVVCAVALAALAMACEGKNPKYVGSLVKSGDATLADAQVSTDGRTPGGDATSPADAAGPGADQGAAGGTPADATAPGDAVAPPTDAGPTPDAGPPRACGEGQVERMACGLNGRGTSLRECVLGQWSPFGACTDPDVCVDDSTADLICGLHGNGVQVQTCVHGQWAAPGPCQDPDRRCQDGEVESLACGLNGRGTQSHTCVNGVFGALTPCVDPDLCVDGARDRQACGLNGRGEQLRSCERGQWPAFGACADPDTCVDGAVDRRDCPDGGQQSRTCVGGQFGDFGACPPPVGNLCDAPSPVGVGLTNGRLSQTDQFSSSCNLNAHGEAVHVFTAPAAGVYGVRISAHAADFSISLRPICDAAVESACVVNGQTSLALAAGQRLFIVVEGTANRTDYTLEVSAQVVENSACTTPTPLPNNGIDAQTHGANTLGANCTQATGPERVFVFVPPANDVYTFSTAGTNFDTVLSLRRSCLDAATEIACQDDLNANVHTSVVSAALNAGELVYVIVDGFAAGDAGAFHLAVSRPEPLADEAPMIEVPAGPFYRGATANNQPAAERPVRVIQQAAFRIDQHEVTVAQYRRCVEAGRCPLPSDADGCNYAVAGRDAHPVNCLSWNEAQNYCLQVGKRLPTEAEWEKTARGGCDRHGTPECVQADDAVAYPWGNDGPVNCQHAWLVGCAEGATAAVPATSPAGDSSYGVQDLAGNVSEATADCYNATFYANGPDTDPVFDSPACAQRTARGGDSSGVDWRDIRAARRIAVDPTDPSLGIRCAR